MFMHFTVGKLGKMKAIANEIYVFDWEGRAVKKVILIDGVYASRWIVMMNDSA